MPALFLSTEECDPNREALLKRCEKHIPVDRRSTIEGMKAVNGGIRRKSGRPPDLPGLPEALVLFYEYSNYAITFETPSEDSIYRRVCAQKALIEGALELVRREGR